MTDQILRELGEIKGLLTGVKEQQSELKETIGSMDTRLRAVEKSGALSGAVTGGIMAVAVGLIEGVLRKGG